MPKNLCAFLLCLLSTCCYGQNMLTHTLAPESKTGTSLKNKAEIFIDSLSDFNIESILNTKLSEFGHPELKSEYHNIAVWSRITFQNNDAKTREEFLTFCVIADSISIYKVTDGRVVTEMLTGIDVKPWHKKIFSSFNFVPVSMAPAEQATYYWRVKFNGKVTKKHLRELAISSQGNYISEQTSIFTAQSFYAGFMILFCGICLLMSHVFKERIFIYFGLLLIAFVSYFLSINGIFQTLVSYFWHGANTHVVHLSISLIVFSLYLFVSKYIDLADRFPKLNKIISIVTIVVGLFMPVVLVFGKSTTAIMNIHNIGLLIWIVLIMAPIVYLAKKDRPARILLYSIGIVFVGSLLYILQIVNFIPPSWLTKNGFQLGTIFFSGIIFKNLFDRINNIRNEKDRMEQLGKIKSRFFANISHEFRTPLTLVMGPIQNQIDKTDNPQDKKALTTAYQNSERLLQLINQLLDLSKLESGKMKLNSKQVNFSSLLKGIVMSFESMAQRKNIKLHFVSQREDIILFVDQDKIEKVFFNLLSNAFKFSNDYGEISVMISDRPENVEVIVRDSGIGMSEAQIAHIFDRFYQVDDSDTRELEGTGIGLALVNELVRLHKGTIQVESKQGRGSTFTIRLPKINADEQNGFSHLGAQIDVSNYSDHSQNSLPDKHKIINPLVLSGTKPSVLIIEDNADVRQYVRQHLDASYELIEGQNGKEGIELALKYLPDLIISDVMMPQKSGYEVTEILKTNPLTSHIPIILLTAKAAQEEKIKGLETGADDYLVKPFNSKELSVRVKNLIALRIELRKRFGESSFIDTTKVSANPVDQKFMESIIGIIEENITNNQFNVDFLADKMGMSRGHLNRKLKALSDLSVSKFIQTYRLNKAAELLKIKAGNVSEVAFQTGFSSTAYFVKCFKEKFGVTPGEFVIN